MYTPDDPDWREYQKLQQDEKLMTRIKVQVVGMIVQTALPEYASSLFAVGANQNRIHMNLDIIPPVRPPTIYEISCLYFGPDRCTWGWHQLPDNIGSKVQHIFHPFVFREAFYASRNLRGSSTRSAELGSPTSMTPFEIKPLELAPKLKRERNTRKTPPRLRRCNLNSGSTRYPTSLKISGYHFFGENAAIIHRPSPTGTSSSP